MILLSPTGCVTESGDPLTEIVTTVEVNRALQSYTRQKEREDAEKRKADEVLRDARRRQRRAGIEFSQQTANKKVLRRAAAEERARAVRVLETPGGEGGDSGH